jgi:phage gpG-like protein
MNDNAKILKEAQKKAQQEIRAMVIVMGNDALNHFEQSFRNEGFTDEALVKWKPRKKRERAGRAILTKTGRLRRSLKKLKYGNYAIKITSNVVYANRHNEGLNRMPVRQFVGYSAVLNRKLIAKFDSKIKAIFA